MDESGDALVLGEPDRRAKPGVIGRPFGEPGRREAQGPRRDDHGHADRAGRQHLLPFGDFDMRSGARDDADHQRRAGEPAELRGSAVLVQFRHILEADVERDTACPVARFPLEHDEAPGRELAVIGHARGDGQDRLQFLSRRTGARHDRGRRGAAALEQRYRVVHRQVPQPEAVSIPRQSRGL